MLRPIPPQQLGEVWAWVREGLQDCIAKTGEPYLPEDVYAQIKAAGSFLYAIERQGRDVGFAVLQQHMDMDGPVLFVWALWCKPGMGLVIEREFVTELDGLAAQIKARRIRMQSPRKGWERRRFFRPVAVVYEREVAHDRQIP